MKVVTVKGLELQFDVLPNTPAHKMLSERTKVQIAHDAIELINLSLQREPYNLSAQILDAPLSANNVILEEKVW